MPTEAQWKDIRAILGTLERCRILVDDPATAPHLVDLAWRWARIPRHVEVSAAIRALSLDLLDRVDALSGRTQQLVERVDALPALLQRQGLQEQKVSRIPSIDPAELAARLAAVLPPLVVNARVDVGIKERLREVLSTSCLIAFGLVLGATGYGSWWWGQHRQREMLAPVFARQATELQHQEATIDRLRADLRHGR
uniref:Transmembrane protein n=1 Tax=mine drainage metagenome TaxID=410659 RepID=E6PP69_9ZZZZ